MKCFLKRTGLLCLVVILLPAISYASIYSGSCGQDVKWKLDTETGLLEIYNSQPGGYSIMDDYSFTTHSPWYSYKTNIRSVSLSGISNIGNCAFYDCRGLTSITIPEGVTSIGSSAFYGCSGLTSITIPESVTSIGSSAFYSCSGLTSITIPEGVTSIGESAFSSCSSLTSITIPESVTSIESYAFWYCRSMTSITIPENVTSIGSSAFADCSSLTSIIIPESVTSIGNSVFSGCRSLTSIAISESVTSIGQSAFSGCSSLTSITIPEGVTSIGSNTFYGCSGLTSIAIPESVTTISGYAFKGCSNLTSITIPESVKAIGIYAFESCDRLKSVTLNSNAFISADYRSSSNLGEIFGSQVKEYVLSDAIRRIGGYAFSSCTEMTRIIMGRNIERIQEYAFSGCSKLEEVYVKNPEPPIIFENAVHANGYYAILYVPEGAQAKYKETDVWKKFARICTIKDESQTCILAIKSAVGGCVEMGCNRGVCYTFTIKAETGWQVSSVSFNGTDVTANITDGVYTTPLLQGDSELNVVFEMDAESIDDVGNVDAYDNLRVTASASTVYIHNEGDSVNSSIYTVDGKQAKSLVIPHGTTRIPVQPDNVYIVKVNNRTFKVAL